MSDCLHTTLVSRSLRGWVVTCDACSETSYFDDHDDARELAWFHFGYEPDEASA